MASPVLAQRWQVDAGGARSELDTLATLNSASLAPFIEWDHGRVYAALGAILTGFEGAAGAAQGRGDLSLLLAPFGPYSPLRVETAGLAAGTVHSSDFRTLTARTEARVHLSGRHTGAWLGGVLATGWTSAERSFVTASGPSVGSWGRYGTARAALVLTPLRLEGSWFPELDGRVSVVAGRLDLLGYAGWRHGPGGSGFRTTSWGGVTSAWWFVDRAALVVTGGTYAADLLQGLPGGRFVSAGLRVASQRAPVPSIKPAGRPVYDVTRGRGILRFSVPGATRVDVTGDWTRWQPIPMQQAPDGKWVLQLELPSGVYRFNLVVDGERWIVPDGVTPMDDGFGGTVGVLVVP